VLIFRPVLDASQIGSNSYIGSGLRPSVRAQLLYLWLPLAGGLSGLLATFISSPWVDTLRHPGMSPLNPAFYFTLDSQWGLVKDLVSGALVCGSFAFILNAYLHGFRRALLPLLFGLISGSILWWIADSTADRIGISMGLFAGEIPGIVWTFLVPPAVATGIVIASGPTRTRWIRAGVASLIAIPVTFMARQVAGIVAVAFMISRANSFSPLSDVPSATDAGAALLQAAIPAWTAEAVVMGMALGLVFAVAEQIISTGCLFMAVSKNEGRVWPLDKPINRIGTQEGVEVRLPMSPSVAPIHATIVQKSGCLFFQPVGSAPTGLNGYAVDSAWLTDGDVLGIGGIDLVFYGRARPPANAPAMVRSAAAPEPLVRKDFRLIDSMGTVHSLGQGQWTIGRDKDAAISLGWDPSVSRMHAVIDVQGERVLVRDLASQSGVRVGPILVREQVLKPGDVITLGRTTLTFRD